MLAVWLIGLTACFASSLLQLVNYALHSAEASHILLVPVISIYLIRLRRDQPKAPINSSPILGFVSALIGLAAVIGYFKSAQSGWKPALNDYLAVMAAAYLSFLFAGWLLFLGKAHLRSYLFPAAFLVFVIPLPEVVKAEFESLLQHTSAVAATAMLTTSGMPVLREGTTLMMPGFAFEVAPECSGIRSTLVLLLTSLLASHLLLRKQWSRAVLVFAVIPLGILRNGFRVFVLAQLCSRISPDMIHSGIHKKGGPIFFILSLLPLFLLFWLLRNAEKRRASSGPKTSMPSSKQSVP